MAEFRPFGAAVAKRFAELSKSELFVVGNDEQRQHFFDWYLMTFPEGTNPLYKTRTEHDCSCCRNFVKNLGFVVAINDQCELMTVWEDLGDLPEPYATVAQRMDTIVRSLPITSVFRTKERSYGAAQTKQLLEDKSVLNWHHFHGAVQAPAYSSRADELRGEYNTNVAVLKRGLEELTKDALSDVLELIRSKSLYRGEEFEKSVREFYDLKHIYGTALPKVKERLVWKMGSRGVAKFRNTAIGTLVQDLSADVPLEDAVKAFESKVAPINYKRTTALVTPAMVKNAQKTVKELGLESALERRLANIHDISVNNVLWVAEAVRSQMKGGNAMDRLLAETKLKFVPTQMKSGVPISIDEFVSSVLPTAKSMSLLIEHAHLTNFATLTTAVHADAGKLFKWNNPFGWSYDGNITDAIRERVKGAGGKVDGTLRFSLAWHNYDDLDLHVVLPSKHEIYFGSRRGPGDGELDVDMNAGVGRTREPVENVVFQKELKDGAYRVYVHNFNKRETTNVGFTVQVAHASGTLELRHPKAVAHNQRVDVITLIVKNGVPAEMKFGEDIESSAIPQTKWGLETGTMVPVRTILHSPNHWDGQKLGNRHTFFVLDGCATTEPMRGIYNEFLSPELEKHRKVFEILGDTTKCPPVPEQLSGLGFSSTRGDTVRVSVTTGNSLIAYEIKF